MASDEAIIRLSIRNRDVVRSLRAGRAYRGVRDEAVEQAAEQKKVPG